MTQAINTVPTAEEVIECSEGFRLDAWWAEYGEGISASVIASGEIMPYSKYLSLAMDRVVFNNNLRIKINMPLEIDKQRPASVELSDDDFNSSWVRSDDTRSSPDFAEMIIKGGLIIKLKRLQNNV